MKKINIDQLVNKFKEGIKNFPVSCALGLGTAIWHIALIKLGLANFPEDMEITLWLAVISFFALELFILRYKKYKLYSYPALALLLVLVYFIIPENILGYHILIIFVSSITIFLAAFLAAKDFRSDNITIILRLIGAYTLSSLLHTAIMIALLTVNYLFSLDINEKIYLYLAIFFYNFLAYIVFLSFIPIKKELLGGEGKAIKGIDLLGKYFFFPVACVYLAILYVYSAQILITGDWPKGMVSYLIIGAAGVGVLTTLLAGNNLKKLLKIYYAALIPILGILFWAIKMRIDEYGLTEKRYYVIAGGLWLLGLSLYFIFSKKMNVRVINYSLIVLLILSLISPISSYGLSKKAQLNRLDNLLSKTDFQGYINKDIYQQLNNQDQENIDSIIQYIASYHGPESINSYFKKDISNYDYYEINDLYYDWADDSEENDIVLESNYDIKGFDIQGYNHLYKVETNDVKELQIKDIDFSQSIEELINTYEPGMRNQLEEVSLETENAKLMFDLLIINPRDKKIEALIGYLLTK